jgi:hypothetical protein
MARCPKCGTEGLELIRGADGRFRLMNMEDATMHYTVCEAKDYVAPAIDFSTKNCIHEIPLDKYCDECYKSDPPSNYQ